MKLKYLLVEEAIFKNNWKLLERLLRRAPWHFASAFEEACKQNNPMLAMQIVRGFADQSNIHEAEELCFRAACTHGHLQLAKWLLSLEPTYGTFDIHAVDHDFYLVSKKANAWSSMATFPDAAFRRSLENGYIEVARWLLSLEQTRGEISPEAFSYVSATATDAAIQVMSSPGLSWEQRLRALEEFKKYKKLSVNDQTEEKLKEYTLFCIEEGQRLLAAGRS